VALRTLLLALVSLSCFAADSAASLAAQLRQLALDPAACYRVRDITLQREDARIYLTDGHLIFSQPVAGRSVIAIFSATDNGDDGEVIIRPPNRSERTALAKATGSPNLDEHFVNAVFVFTDNTAEELLASIRSGASKPDPDMGELIANRLNEMVRNFGTSFQDRLVLDLAAHDSKRSLFYAGFAGKTLGNFDLLYDPSLPEDIILGQVNAQKGGTFSIWSSFLSRSRRKIQKPLEEDAILDNFRIEATLQPNLHMTATTKATLKPLERLEGAMSFELAPQMQVTAALLDGQPVEFFRRESLRSNLVSNRTNEPFLIALPKPLEAGSTHEVEFRHEGTVVRPSGNGVFFVAARTSWYPMHGVHFATYDITLRVPKDLNVVATGDLAEETLDGDTRVVRRRTSRPVRLAGFNIGSYESAKIARGDVEVEVYANRRLETALTRGPQVVVVPPGTSTRGASRGGTEVMTMNATQATPTARLNALANEVASAFEWMATQFGPPPLRAMTVSPIPGNFGQGFPGLLYISTLSFLNDKDRPSPYQTAGQHTFYSEILHAHETAHQWWGNLVTSPSYHDDWIQEALANYSALLVLERKSGAKALETTLDEYRRELASPLPDDRTKVAEQEGPITWGLRLQTDARIEAWRIITYNKGSWIMHMLRRRMGDPPFFALLRELCKRYAYRPLTTEQFRLIAAEFSPKGLPDPTLENFFDNWVYGTGLPTIESTISTRGKAPNVTVSVSVRQTGVGDEFGVDLPVEVRLPGNPKPLVKWLRTAPDSTTVVFNVPAIPAKVEVAPGLGVLANHK